MIYWLREYDVQTGLLYMSILLYMSVTYLTDNTSLYFWCSVGLRLIPMSFSYRVVKKEPFKRWKPPTSADAANEIRAILMRKEQ